MSRQAARAAAWGRLRSTDGFCYVRGGFIDYIERIALTGPGPGLWSATDYVRRKRGLTASMEYLRLHGLAVIGPDGVLRLLTYGCQASCTRDRKRIAAENESGPLSRWRFPKTSAL